MPTLQILFFGLFAATWLIGGNILIAVHCRRLGKPWWSGLKSFAFPFANFNAGEWLVFFLLGVIAFVFGALALNFGSGSGL